MAFFAIMGAVAVFFLAIFCLRFLYDFRIDDEGVVLLVLRTFRVVEFRFDEIKAVRAVKWYETGIGGTTLRLGNRLVATCVLMEMRNGIFRRIVITPPDPVAFAARVRLRVTG
ncbi:MAG: hypothetical protein KF800_12745 [Lysobacter sp.]|nr:hypothetical protein [Lysobacter sp.]